MADLYGSMKNESADDSLEGANKHSHEMEDEVRESGDFNPLAHKTLVKKKQLDAELTLCSLKVLGFDTLEYSQAFGKEIMPDESMLLSAQSFDTHDEKLLLVRFLFIPLSHYFVV